MDIANFYNNLATEHGYSHKTADASSQETLNIRYKALSEVCDMNNKKVLEVGCGVGMLGAYLAKKYPQIKYTGIDVAEKTILIAKEKHPDLKFVHCDVIRWSEVADIVMAEGIFYKLSSQFEVNRVLQKMLDLAAETIAFTAIDSWGYPQDHSELRIVPELLIQSLKKTTWSMVFRHDYHPSDSCFYLFRK